MIHIRGLITPLITTHEPPSIHLSKPRQRQLFQYMAHIVKASAVCVVFSVFQGIGSKIRARCFMVLGFVIFSWFGARGKELQVQGSLA